MWCEGLYALLFFFLIRSNFFGFLFLWDSYVRFDKDLLSRYIWEFILTICLSWKYMLTICPSYRGFQLAQTIGWELFINSRKKDILIAKELSCLEYLYYFYLFIYLFWLVCILMGYEEPNFYVSFFFTIIFC